MQGHIEVSKNETVINASRPSGTMQTAQHFTKECGVKRATKMLRKYGATFSHYVKSLRHGKIAVYVVDDGDMYMSLRLKNYRKRQLNKIKKNLNPA